MFVTLVGGGNSTLCMAPLVASAGHTVAILTRKPEVWSPDVTVVNEDLGWLKVSSITCKPDYITSDPAEVIPKSDVVWLCGVPIHHNPSLLASIAPHLPKDKQVLVGSICAYGGFNWVARQALGMPPARTESSMNSDKKENIVLFGTQLIPWCCGTKEYGKTGVIFGAKRMLRIATESGTDTEGVKSKLQDILRQRLVDTDFLASALWPNNPSLHPPILYGLFKDWDGKTGFIKESLPVRIYAEMTEASAKYTEELDQELQSIVAGLSKKFPENANLRLDFSLRSCILENYEDQVTDSSNVASTIRTNAAFGKHNVPYEPCASGNAGEIVPIIKHKFFETDLPFGLVLWKDLAGLCGVDTPLVDAIVTWNQSLIGKEYINPRTGALDGRDIGECIVPTKMGITLENLQ